MDNQHYTYILASKPRGAMYIGTTADLAECIMEHKANLVDGITSLYAIHQLVYFERFDHAGAALLREQDIRRMPRLEKLALIEQYNPGWRDLFDDIAAANNRSARDQPEPALI